MSSSEDPDPQAADRADRVTAAEDRIARARMRRAGKADEGDVAPRLPRGSGFKISKGHLFKITLTAGLLVMLIAIQRPCADAVSKFVTSFDEQGSDSSKMPQPGTVERGGSQQFEVIRSDMSEAEMRAAVERARARAGATGSADGSGSAGTGSANGSGTR